MKISFYIICVMLFSVMSKMALAQNNAYNTVIDKNEPNDGVIRKHTRLIGTFFNFGNTFDTESKNNGVKTGTASISLGGSLVGGYMLSNHLGAIVNLGISDVNTETYDEKTDAAGNIYDLKSHKTNYIFTGALRYYKLVSEGNYFFVQLSGQYNFGQDRRTLTNITKSIDYINNYSYNGGGVSLNPGFTAFISHHLAAEISVGVLGYAIQNGKDDNGNTITKGGFQFLLYQNSVNLGFVYYF